MPKRKRLKAASQVGGIRSINVVHDRRATDLPRNAVVCVDEVDDPWGKPTKEDPHPKITVIRSLADPLAWLKHHGKLKQYQITAGNIWQKLYFEAEIGALKAMDPTKEPVDGGGSCVEILTDKRRHAVAMLARCSSALGWNGDRLIRDILGLGMSIEEVAGASGWNTSRGQRDVRTMLCIYLDILAKVLGCA